MRDHCEVPLEFDHLTTCKDWNIIGIIIQWSKETQVLIVDVCVLNLLRAQQHSYEIIKCMPIYKLTYFLHHRYHHDHIFT
jgi:hypothetical protein